jgi:ABC-type amino acid transport system permease subunit
MDSYLTLLSFGDQGWGDEIAWGVLVTISLALATLPVGLFIGFMVALGKQSGNGRCAPPPTSTRPFSAACPNC